MKKKFLWVGLVILAFLVIAVAVLALTFKMPEFVGIDDIEIQEFDGKDLHAQVNGKIFNGNFFSLSASKLEYLVTYHDTLIGHGKLPDGLKLGANDTTKLELPIQMGLQAIFAVHQSMLRQEKCKIDIHLEGQFTNLHYNKGLDFQMEIQPTEFIAKVLATSMGSAPISLSELSWKTTDLKSSEFSFVSMVKNPLDLPLELGALNLEFFNDGERTQQVGNWKLEKPVPLKPQYNTRVPGTVKIQHLQAGAGMIKTVFSGEIRYQAAGKLTILLANLPFEIPIAGTIVIDPKTGKGRWEGEVGMRNEVPK